MKTIYLDTETIGTPQDFPNEDIMFQLSYIIEDSKLTFFNDYMKPKRYLEMKPEAMAITSITPEFLEDKPKKEETCYMDLKEILENEECYLIAHNLKFDLEVLQNSGININSKVKLIDTIKVFEFLNDKQALPYKQITLQYLKYFYRLDKEERPKEVQGLSSHDSLNDAFDLYLLVNLVKEKFRADLDMMLKLNEPFMLEYIPFGKNRGDKFKDLSYNQLKYYSSLDGNVAFTCKKILGE